MSSTSVRRARTGCQPPTCMCSARLGAWAGPSVACAGSRYAILTTEMAPQPDKKTGRIPTEEELARWQRVRPIMNEILQGAGLVKVAEDKVLVTGLKGPLEEGWQQKVAAFAARIPLEVQGADNGHGPAA